LGRAGGAKFGTGCSGAAEVVSKPTATPTAASTAPIINIHFNLDLGGGGGGSTIGATFFFFFFFFIGASSVPTSGNATESETGVFSAGAGAGAGAAAEGIPKAGVELGSFLGASGITGSDTGAAGAPATDSVSGRTADIPKTVSLKAILSCDSTPPATAAPRGPNDPVAWVEAYMGESLSGASIGAGFGGGADADGDVAEVCTGNFIAGIPNMVRLPAPAAGAATGVDWADGFAIGAATGFAIEARLGVATGGLDTGVEMGFSAFVGFVEGLSPSSAFFPTPGIPKTVLAMRPSFCSFRYENVFYYCQMSNCNLWIISE
jgi:hypothetical protein